MKIAVAGCGIAGTAVGSLLARAGHTVTIFEQAPECKPIGAGILIQPSGLRVLDELDIRQTIEQRSARLDGLEARLKNGRQLVRLKYAKLNNSDYGLGVHRGYLFDQLLQLCRNAGVEIRNHSIVTGYEESEKHIRLQLSGDTCSEPFDGLVAADGSRSRLREVCGIPFTRHEYQYAALWTTGSHNVISDRLYQVIDQTQKLVGLLPIGKDECSFFWGIHVNYYQSLIESDLQMWKEQVLQICPQAADLLATIHGWEDLTFARYQHVKMKRWNTGRVVFIGDAAHPSSPHLGQGANLALEDASIFNSLLGPKNNFFAAGEAFTKRRLGKIRYYQSLTQMLTPFFQSDYSLLGWGRNMALPIMPHLPIVGRRMLRTLRGDQTGWFW